MKVATNIFGSPANTGPGNFGRRLAVALSSLGIDMLPAHALPNPDVFMGNAFLDGYRGNAKATVLRVDGPGIHGDIARVEHAHKTAGVVIYQSEYSRNVLQKAHDYTPIKSYVINNGIQLPNVYRDQTDDLNILSICHNWSKERYLHYYHVVYNNLTYLVEKFPNLKWNIVGKYKPFKAAMSYSSVTHPDLVDKHIRFIEFTPDLDMHRRSAKICIHIVGGDSCPNSVIESMSYGLPCVVWEDSAGPELIDYDHRVGGAAAGVVIGSYYTRDIIGAIQKILYAYEYYSQNARKLAEEKFDINVVAQKYAEVFHAAA